MDESDTVQLTAGMRVIVELPSGATSVARVADATGARLVLRMLDPVPDGDLTEGGAVSLLLGGDAGLWRWPALLRRALEGDAVRLELAGPPRIHERRGHRRLRVRLPAECRRVRQGRRGNARGAVIEDLSRGGMRLRTGGLMETGDRVEVHVDLEGDLLTVTGRVVMIRPAGRNEHTVSLAFSDPLGAVVAAIDAYLAERLDRAS